MEEAAVYAVVLPLDAVRVGVPIRRASWPLHVTLVPDVRSSAGLDRIVGVLREAARRVAAPTTTVREPAWLGPDEDVLVDLIDADELRQAHVALLDALETYAGAVPLVAAYQRGGYRPHVTVSPHERVRSGERLTLTRIALVEIGPGGRPDLVVPVAMFDLASDAAPPVPTTMHAASVIEISEALTAAHVRHWLIGGWGVDALLGATTREHHDLDLFVDVGDLPAMLEELNDLGMTVRYVWSESRPLAGSGLPSAFVADGRLGELDVHVVAVQGHHAISLSAGTVTLPGRALEGVGTIAGTAVPCATAEAQLIMHSGYDLPPAHLVDVERLRSIVAT
jgi:lincosamide nucleotidyltransferase A/C/D/E